MTVTAADAAPDADTESPLAPSIPVSGTRKRLDHVDAMRPVKQFGVVSTHTLLFFAPIGTGLAVGASLQLLHVTREAFLFISACMIAYSFREVVHFELRPYWRRRFTSVGIPYLCWTLIYFFVTLHGTTGSVASRLDHLAYLVGTGYYQLYFLVVLLEFYAVFPLLLILLRRTVGHHGLLLADQRRAAGAHRLPHALGGAPALDAGLLGHPRSDLVPVLSLRRAWWLPSTSRRCTGGCVRTSARARAHPGQCRLGRRLVLPRRLPRRLVARLELRPLPADRHPLEHRRDRQHLPPRRVAGRSPSLRPDTRS